MRSLRYSADIVSGTLCSFSFDSFLAAELDPLGIRAAAACARASLDDNCHYSLKHAGAQAQSQDPEAQSQALRG